LKTRKFVDHVTVFATAGNGGNGSASFRREKFVPKGGPDGGDGGRGGHVILRGDRDTDSLIALYFAPLLRAGHGGNGAGQQKHGRNGLDKLIKIPCGTEIWDTETDTLLGDIITHGQELIIARGGNGGIGNVHFKSSTHQAPTEQTDGEPGQDVTLRLELKIMADIGLVGFPNAGKSSLLTALSDAHPKVAAYPFTTLNPVLGTVLFEDYTKLRIADIPGIISGAHEGVGLGYDFLRHIERSRFLLLVLDMAGVDTRNPVDDYQSLISELTLYDAELPERPHLVIANKMDLPEAAENMTEFIRQTGISPLPISTLAGTGIAELKTELHALCRRQN
jgi:GTP-binding protein